MILVTVIAALATAGDAEAEPANLFGHPPCSVVDAHAYGSDPDRDVLAQVAAQSCRLDPPQRADALALLAGERFAFHADPAAGRVTIAARPRGGGAGRAHGGLNVDLDDLGAGVYASRFRLARLGEAMLSFYVTPDLQSGAPGAAEAVQIVHWRGPNAPALPIAAPDPLGAVETRTLHSESLQETRRLVIYTPPGHDPAGGPYPVVLMADGGDVHHYGRMLDPHIASGRLAPILLVGLVSGQDGIVEDRSEVSDDLRNVDYLPDFLEPYDRFPAHLVFAAEEATAYAREHFAASAARHETVVYGRSSGGGFAYHAALRRPDVFGAALAHSPGATVPGEPPAAGVEAAEFHIAAGLYEPGFLYAARNAEIALRGQGYDVALTELAAGHTQEISTATLIDTLSDLFPGPRRVRP